MSTNKVKIFFLFMLLAVAPQAASALGLVEAAPVSEWTVMQGRNDICGAEISFNSGHALKVIGSPSRDTLSLNVKFNKPILDPEKVYETDIFVDVDLNIFVTGKPLNDREVSFGLGSADQFLPAIQTARELSLGLGDDLYIFSLKGYDFPNKNVETCLASQGEERAPGFLDSLDFFAEDNAVPQSEPVIVESASIAAEVMPEPEIMVVNRGDELIVEAVEAEAKVEIEAEPEVGLEAETGAEPVAIVDAGPYDPLMKAPPAKPRSIAKPATVTYGSVNHSVYADPSIVNHVADPEVVDISNLNSDELPERLEGIENYLSDNRNYDESQDLIESLLVQIDMIEKEKELLRSKFVEDSGPLSVIRSCQKEKDVAATLRRKLRRAEGQIFELRKRQEITEDLLMQYEGSGAEYEEVALEIEEPADAEPVIEEAAGTEENLPEANENAAGNDDAETDIAGDKIDSAIDARDALPDNAGDDDVLNAEDVDTIDEIDSNLGSLLDENLEFPAE